MTKRRHHLHILLAVLIIVLMTAIPIKVSADTGPKPELVIKVVNPPQGEYYLDLLIQGGDHVEPNIGERSEYDPEKLVLLENYKKDGWFPALTVGTDMPLWGDLTGVKTDSEMVHTFSYFGLPDDFKIILITPDNQIRTTEQIHRENFRTVLIYDYATSVVSTETTTEVSYVKQFLTTFLTTILVEGLLLLLFRFSLRKSLIPFLIINFVTQVFLTITTGAAFASGGLLVSFIVFIPVEFIITAAETIAFVLLLKEHSRGRRAVYALTANFVSALVGLVAIAIQYNS